MSETASGNQESSKDRAAPSGRRSQIVAWGVCAAIAVLASWARPSIAAALEDPRLAPSPSVLALVFGMVLGAIPGIRQRLAAGAKRVSKEAIPVAIVLIGFGLELGQLVSEGTIAAGIAIVLVAMAVAFAASLGFGRLLGLDVRTSLLLGAGTAICGNSAIMAVAPAVEPEDDDLALSIGVINLLGVVMLFALPPLAGWFGIEGVRGGALAGLTVHAVPQAIATGEAFGVDAIEWATLYKLMRVAMLAPVVVLLVAILRRVRGPGSGSAAGGGVPLFLVLFIAAAIVRALGFVDRPLALGQSEMALWEWAKQAGQFLLGIALAAIGVGLSVRTLVRVGPKVLIVAVAAVATMIAAAAPLVRLWL